MPTDANRQLPVLPLVAVGLIILGAFGPWVSVEGFDDTETGLESDGVITLVLALIAGGLLLAFRAPRPRGAFIGLAICAVLCLVISIIDVLDVTGTDLGVIEAQVGWGLWLTLAGSIVLVVALVISRSQTTAPPPSQPPAVPPA